MDFSRKMLILGREIGLPLEMSDVNIKDFLPDACLKAESIPAFYEELEKHEPYFSSFKKEAENFIVGDINLKNHLDLKKHLSIRDGESLIPIEFK